MGLLIVFVWPFVSDDDQPYESMARYRNRLAAGSYDGTADPIAQRGREKFTAFFDGLTVVDPGIVHCTDWHPWPQMPRGATSLTACSSLVPKHPAGSQAQQ